MAKIIVLGGSGAVGSVAVKTVASFDEFSEVVIGDLNIEKAREIVSGLGSDKVTAREVDALDPTSVREAITGCDLVLNCSGPFYKLVPVILDEVIRAGIDYVDVCDDVDVTSEILKLDNAAKDAGITALIGMGSSPGVTNLMGKFAADRLLDEVEAVDIYHAHGGEPEEGEGVIAHRFHCMTIDIPMFLDGELKTVHFFDDDGIALREEVDLYRVGEKIMVYPYPHPEQLTMPQHIKLKRVTNKGTVLPDQYFQVISDVCRAGLTSRDPLEVKGRPVVPYDFSMAHILRERERILAETWTGPQRGCVKVVVTGTKEGRAHRYQFSIASEDQALGEGTGIPAAFGALLMQLGKVTEKGVLPPEACVDPADFITLIQSILKPEKGGASFEGVLVESIDADGKVEKMYL